jgi:glycosyltransferase involved in cell wall biosynthesis
MRIAFVTNPWAFQLPGGGEQVLLDSREALRRRGHDVVLFDPWTDKLTEFDLVHYFHSPGWDAWSRIATLRPLVVTPTLWCDTPQRPWLVRQLRHAAHRLIARWWCPPFDERDIHYHLMIPNLLLPASDAEADRLQRFAGIPRSRMRVVRNTVVVGEATVALPAALGRALSDGGRILCVGSFHRHKNQLGLIRALRGTSSRVVFIGGRYPDDQTYLDRCRTEADGQHWFFDPQPRPVVLAAMRRARVYAQPSLRETCGLAALEAAACGCRVAITHRGATREYFGDHAWYFDPDDHGAIRRALAAAAAASVDGSLATCVQAQHSLERVGSDLETAYRSIGVRA